jgi:F-type H+-transporting ATPase subunit a
MDLLTRMVPELLAAAEEGKHGGSHGPSFWGVMVYTGIVLCILFGLLANAKKGLGDRVFKRPLTQAAEQLYLFVERMCVNTIGGHGRKYVPFIMTFWLVIFIGNVVSLFFPSSITADVGFNLGMALISIGYVQWEGIKQNGFLGHFKHFAGPKLGPALIIINALIFLIEIISEALKNVSLSLRLYGNIHGGHMAGDAMNQLGAKLIPLGDAYLGIPFGLFLMPIKLLTCVVQALIFCLLTCVYISLVTHEPHDDHGHEHEEDPAHTAHRQAEHAAAH